MSSWLRRNTGDVAINLIYVVVLIIYIFIVIPYTNVEGGIRRRRNIKPRIAWGTTPIIAIRYGSLADRLYGYKSDTIAYSVQRIINEPSDFDYVLDQYLKRKGILNMPLRLFILLARRTFTLSIFTFMWASLKYDIFHFYFDGGFKLRLLGRRLELSLLNLAGKKIIVVPYGGDARLESRTRKYKYNACMDCYPDTKVCDEKQIRNNLEYFCKHCDIVLGCADLVDDLPRHDGIWLYPIDLSEWQPVPHQLKSETIKIVHATNHRKYKGTRFLISMVDELKSEGYPVELILIERMQNKEAKIIYQQADIIADQFIAGAYAQFSMEGMALGKPVMCYLREELFSYHPEWAECPIVNTNPENLKQQLIMLISDRKLRQELGQRGVEYVKKYHSLEAVGSQMDKMYRYLWSQKQI